MFKIRRARHEDAHDIITSHMRSIRETCSRDYNPDQIEAWSGRDFRVDRWQQIIDKDLVWVVEVDSQVKGFGHLAFFDNDSAEVMGLYFAPEVHGLGAGKKLLNMIKDETKSRGIKELHLQSTITAKLFYEHNGFKQVEGNCSVKIRGVAITCFPMKCIIE